MHLKTIADFLIARLQTLLPLSLKKRIETMKFKGLFNPFQLTLQRFTYIEY